MSQAISPELREWLVAQLAAGHSVPALRASMRAAGWQPPRMPRSRLPAVTGGA